MIRPKFVQPAFLFKINSSAQCSFFLKAQRCPRGNGWKQSEIAPSLGKKHMFLHNFQTCFMNICYKTATFLPSEGAISDCFQPFPLGHLWTFKKNFVARKCFFTKKIGLDKFWPDHVSDCFRPFPTVSFFLND